jgi:hypothetical protein
MSKVAYLQPWIESERDWGTRDDGYTIAGSREQLAERVGNSLKQQREIEKKIYKGQVPDCYSRPEGQVELIEVSDLLYAEINSGKITTIDKLSEIKQLEFDVNMAQNSYIANGI